MRDFTLLMYDRLLRAIYRSGYHTVPMSDFIENKLWKRKGLNCVLRHDIDKNITSSLKTAILECEYGFKATYYVRYIKGVYDIDILKQIETIGHEIGFHYETLDKTRGDITKAYKLFKSELAYIRKDFLIRTACMHGYPLNPWRNIDIWKKYDYKKINIVGEPYLDVDYSKVAYFTDTGRCWNSRARVKDYVPSGNINEKLNLNPESTLDLIDIIEFRMVDNIIILTHPNRWSDSRFKWLTEYSVQKFKNLGKRLLGMH